MIILGIDYSVILTINRIKKLHIRLQLTIVTSVSPSQQLSWCVWQHFNILFKIGIGRSGVLNIGNQESARQLQLVHL